MSDRCYIKITMLKEDVPKLIEILGDESDPDDCFDAVEYETQNTVTGICYEADYGWSLELEKLAEQGVSFEGYHGAGSGYAPIAFVGHKSKYISLITDFEGSNIFIPVTEKGVSEKDLEIAKEYFELKNQVLQELFKEQYEENMR